MTTDEWIAEYMRAWRDADPDAAAALFTDDAAYYSNLLQPPRVKNNGSLLASG